MPQTNLHAPAKKLLCAETHDRSGTWFAAGLVALFAIAVLVFWKTACIGYLLDDYLHVEYLNQAAHGNLSGVLTRMYSRWSYATDGLLAYRPGLTLSFWFDYVIWNGQAFGMHVTNILASAAVAVLTALTTVELSTTLKLRHRYWTGLVSGLLFALYPLHAESSAWIVARADILGSIFYLISVITFIRFARTGNNTAFNISVASFLICLTEKECTVTLPVVIAMLALLVCTNVSWKRVSAYWLVLASFAIWRTIAIGQIIGGYGNAGSITLKGIIRTLIDRNTIAKIFFGATEELSVPSILQTLSSSSYAVILACGLFSATRDLRIVRLFSFLVLWCVVTVLPAFQIWHIYPNLIGSRLFYVGSIPFCMLLAYSAVGSSLLKSTNRAALGAGLAAVAVLAATWAQLLQINLIPWTVAGQQMAGFTKQVQKIAESVPTGQRALIVNIPQDFKGASMLGRPQFLEDLCKPPFHATDLSSRICTLQRPISGGHEYIYPELLESVRAQSTAAFVWNEPDGTLVPLKSKAHTSSFNFQRSVAELYGQKAMHNVPGTKSGISVSKQCVEVRLGADVSPVWLSTGAIDPTDVTCIALRISDPKGTLSAHKSAPQLLWHGPDGEHNLAPCFDRGDTYFYLPGRQKNWTLQPKVSEIGFSIPDGEGSIGLQEVRFTNDCSTIEPNVHISILPEHQNDQSYQLWLTDADATSQVSLDARSIANCSGVRLFITKPWQAFDDVVSGQDPRNEQLSCTETISTPSASVSLPAGVLKQPGAHQIAVLPVDQLGKPCGILSEPRSFLIDSTKR